MKQAAVGIDAATATMAPRGAFKRRDWTWRWLPRLRAAVHAAVTSVALSQLALFRTRVDLRLPALSSLRGQEPPQETECAEVGKRVMSMPISAAITRVTMPLTPGIVVRILARFDRLERFQLGIDLLQRVLERVDQVEVQLEQHSVMMPDTTLGRGDQVMFFLGAMPTASSAIPDGSVSLARIAVGIFRPLVPTTLDSTQGVTAWAVGTDPEGPGCRKRFRN